MKPKEERTDSDIEVVVEALKTLKFFQDAQREDANFDEFLTSVYNSLNFEHFHKNQAIFHQGERGSKFYIILKGRVDVYIQKSREEIEKEIKEKKLNHLKDGLAIPKDLFASDYAESNRTSFIKISEDSSELLRKRSEPFNVHLFQEQQHLGRRGSKKHKSSFHKLPPVEKEVSVFSSFPERQESYIENGVVKFKLVRTLISGDTFGEVALSSDMPRSATVIASRDLQVLTLSKAAYKKISENLEKGLKLKWKFFAEITDNSSKEAVLGFCYGFKERTYKYGQTLFFQGQIPKEIFLIREGEVQVKFNSL